MPLSMLSYNNLKPYIWFDCFYFSLIFSSEDKDNFSYRLVGVIEHRGGFNADVGHYIAYVRSSHQQQSSSSSSWFYASDANVREVSLEEVLKCEAYMLFYERMEG